MTALHVSEPPMPSVINIGYRAYAVIEWDALSATCSERVGEISTLRGYIKVRGDLDLAERANTLLHEVIHGAYRNGGLDAADDEERVVNVLANQLSQIIRDNPALVAFLGSAFS